MVLSTLRTMSSPVLKMRSSQTCLPSKSLMYSCQFKVNTLLLPQIYESNLSFPSCYCKGLCEKSVDDSSLVLSGLSCAPGPASARVWAADSGSGSGDCDNTDTETRQLLHGP